MKLYLLRGLREGLGRLLILIDALTRPRPVQRTPEQQAAIDAETRRLALYQFYACPFCLKVRRRLHRLALAVELRDAQRDPQHRQALASGGGRIKVPCLRIEDGGAVLWLYESDAIIDYLTERFGTSATAAH